MEASANSPQATLAAVYRHVVLPPRLPGRQDDDPDCINTALMSRVSDAVRNLQEHADHSIATPLDVIEAALKRCKPLMATGDIEKRILQEEFRVLSPPHFLVLHLQNAGLIIYHDGT